MTTQPTGDLATSQRGHPHFWQRLSPFLDVLGAVLIFGSWIFSNSLSQRAQDQSKTHQAIIDRVHAYRLYDDFARRISDIQSDLARTRILVEQATPSGNSSAGNAQSLADIPTWTGMTPTQVGELKDCLQALDGYAGQLSVPGTITESIDRAKSGASQLSKSFHAARDEYDQLVAKRTASTFAADNDAALQESEEIRRRIDALWHQYDTAKHGMLQMSDELLQTAAAESKSASQLARQCKHLSWALYVLGTMIILFGRVQSAISAKKTKSG